MLLALYGKIVLLLLMLDGCLYYLRALQFLSNVMYFCSRDDFLVIGYHLMVLFFGIFEFCSKIYLVTSLYIRCGRDTLLFLFCFTSLSTIFVGDVILKSINISMACLV